MSDALISALQDPALYDHPVERFEVMETHISWILLTGRYAYKLKKPVNFGFVDFSTLEKRRFFCQEELRLNQRLAPEWYLDVVPITGSVERPSWRGAGRVIEYAVKMRQFPHEARLDLVLARGELTPERVDALASAVADFHGRAAVAAPETPFGTPDRVAARIQENLGTIQERAMDPADQPHIERLARDSEVALAALAKTFAARKRDGFIRECHGDLHLANVAWVDDGPLIFDCIEFNEDLRWIDVMSEIAFLVMDLTHRGALALGRRALNAYLEATGDYEGLRVFPCYHAYRALVRAKVACLSGMQPHLTAAARESIRQEYRAYLELAEQTSQPGRPWIVITHGVSGSGKTWVAQALVESLGAIRIRSDVERKRLFGLSAHTRAGAAPEHGIYAAGATEQTYARLGVLADAVADAGFPAIVDATFLKRTQRNALRAVASARNLPFVILAVDAPEAVLRERIIRRARHEQDASDADLAVLDQQIKIADALGHDEQSEVVRVDTARPLDLAALIAAIGSGRRLD